MKKITPVRLSGVGGNGFKMLLIANVVILFSLGLTLLPCLLRVVRLAWRTGTAPLPQRYLLVLGVKLKDCGLRGDFRLRLERARQLLAEGRGEQAVILGGITSRRCQQSEAAAGRDYLMQQGVSGEAILLEDRSLHTLQNLQRVREMMGGAMQGVLITNRYHLARTAAMAKGLGMSPQLCAAEAQLSLTPVVLFKMLLEAYYLHWYYTGKVWARLVRDHKSLQRIS